MKHGAPISVIAIGDGHIARAPAQRIGYPSELIGMAAEVRAYARACDAAAICCTGDLLHSKNRTTHRDVRFAIELCRAMRHKSSIPFLTVPGNHDMVGNSRQSLMRQPFGVLRAADEIGDVESEPVLLTQGNDCVIVVGCGHCGAREKVREQLRIHIKHIKTENKRVIGVLALTHEEPFPNADKLLHGIGAHMIEAGIHPTAPLVIVNGHEHMPAQQVVEAHNSAMVAGTLVNIGVFGRTSRAERDVVPNALHVAFRRKMGSPSIKLLPLTCNTTDEAFVEQGVAAADDIDVSPFIEQLRERVGVVSGKARWTEVVKAVGLQQGLDAGIVSAALGYLGGEANDE